MATYGVGLDWRTGEYYVVKDGTRRRSFGSCEAAVGYIDADREWEAAEAARDRAIDSEITRERETGNE